LTVATAIVNALTVTKWLPLLQLLLHLCLVRSASLMVFTLAWPTEFLSPEQALASLCSSHTSPTELTAPARWQPCTVATLAKSIGLALGSVCS